MPEKVLRPALERLLRPRSVAIIGASPTPGSLGNGVMGNLARFGFAGQVYLVNPARSEIEGRPCLASPSELPEGVDCAVLAIPGKGVVEAAGQCAGRGVGGLVVFGAGFAEAGEAGVQAQRHLAETARGAGMALAGPNCLGFVNYVDGISLTFGVTLPRPMQGAGAGIISQSGAMATVLRVALQAREIDVSYSISTGNEALHGVEDFLEFLIEDSNTRVLSLIVEQMRSPKRFLDLARRARSLGKPIVLLHPGRSAAARQSAQTHTGALAGDWEVMRAAVTQAGALVVETLEELIDVSEMLHRCPPMRAKGVGMITDSGAFKGMSLDYCEHIGLALPQPGAEAAAEIGAIAPGLVLATNPLDLTAQALVDPQLYRKTFAPMLADERYGAIVFGVILSNPDVARRKNAPILQAIRDFRPQKPVVLAMLGDEAEAPADLIHDFRVLGAPFMRSPERALRALACLARAQLAEVPEAAAEEETPSKAVTGERLARGIIPEYAAKEILSGYGAPFPPGGLARSLEEAQTIAGRIGYPVALKAQSAQLAHKTEAGGVVLHLRDAEALGEGWRKLIGQVGAARPGLKLDGVLVEAMAPRGVELIIGARNDPEWGAVLVIGLGGIFAEALKDVRVMSAALGAAEIAADMRQLKGAALLTGFRGEPPCDVEAAAQIAYALGRFMRAHPEVIEAELNPVRVYAQGQGALALDALVQVG